LRKIENAFCRPETGYFIINRFFSQIASGVMMPEKVQPAAKVLRNNKTGIEDGNSGKCIFRG